MPMYEYKCTKCGKVFSEVRKIDDRNKKIGCTKCGEGVGKFQMSSGSFRI